MTCSNITLLVFIIYTTNLFHYVILLHVEGIYGGYHVKRHAFTYQTGILIPADEIDNPYKLICSGSLIAPNLVLSAAQCFVDDNGDLIKYTYSITCNTQNWKFITGTIILIKKIYFPGGGSYHYLNNIAVSKLKENLFIYNNPDLSTVQIPNSESFYGTIGYVSGYGYSYVMMGVDYVTRKSRRIGATSEHWLKYGEVQVASHFKCKIGNRALHLEKHFCGQMEPARGYNASGVCDNDVGSPFVFNKTILAFPISPREDCDDTNSWGSAYTNVSHYASFINSIIDRDPLNNVLVRYNLIHIVNMSMAAPAA